MVLAARSAASAEAGLPEMGWDFPVGRRVPVRGAPVRGLMAAVAFRVEWACSSSALCVLNAREGVRMRQPGLFGPGRTAPRVRFGPVENESGDDVGVGTV